MEAEENQEKENTGFDIGAALVEARENLNLSTQDIASQLNLTVTVVEKLEQNQFEQDLPIAFVRGYVRAYAQKVGMDVETLCIKFDNLISSNEQPIQTIKRISPFGERRKEINSNSPLIKIITILLVLALVAFGGWELWKRLAPKYFGNQTAQDEIQLSLNHSEEQSESDSTEIILNNADNNQLVSVAGSSVDNESVENNNLRNQNEQVDSVSLDNAGLANADATDNRAALNDADGDGLGDNILADNELNNNVTATEQNANEDQIPDSPTLISGEEISAVFTFSNDCWVQITDANGEVLAVGVKREGKVMPISGIAPWQITLGEPSVVTMTFNNQPYDLSQFGSGRVAKFTLE